MSGKPNCVCPECKAVLSVSGLTPWTDIECPKCGRIFNPLIGEGELIGYLKKKKRKRRD